MNSNKPMQLMFELNKPSMTGEDCQIEQGNLILCLETLIYHALRNPNATREWLKQSLILDKETVFIDILETANIDLLIERAIEIYFNNQPNINVINILAGKGNCCYTLDYLEGNDNLIIFALYGEGYVESPN